MDILISVYKKWADLIFSREKPFEFRKVIGKNISKGDKVYLYETSKEGGNKLVVGEFTVKDIHEIKRTKVGTYEFLPYYCKEVIKDMDAYHAVMNAYAIPLPHYDNSIKLSYIYNPEFLESLSQRGEFPNLGYYSGNKFKKYIENQNKTNKLVSSCDDWLRKIGYYDEYDETYYKYYIEIENPIKYETPLPLTSFKNSRGEDIKYPPQSWLYCTKKEEL